MGQIQFEGAGYESAPGESVLDCLTRNGIDIPHSCKSGLCQSCLVKVTEGTPPAEARKGLKDTLKAQGYMLACSCVTDAPLTLARADAGMRVQARVLAVRKLSELVAELRMEALGDFSYFAGQFVNLVAPGGAIRSYSLASVPGEDEALVFHIARMPQGVVSGWAHDAARENDVVELLGPHGSCCYVSGNPQQPLLLAGTGTGLAPLYGVVRDALSHGHTGDIHLFHGSVRQAGLYLVDELRALAASHENFHYHPCVMEGPADDGTHIGLLDAYLAQTLPSLKGYRVYLCGHPDLVKQLQRKTFLAGASLKEIFSDPFVAAKAG